MAGTKNTALSERNRRICLMRRNGFTFSEIAQMEGISRPRVAQIVAEAHAELPEDDTRAEIASLLEFAERKSVELVNDPGYVCGPNGRVVEGPDGDPLLNKSVMVDALKTLILVAEKRSRLYAADRPAKTIMRADLAQQEAAAALALVAARVDAERREQQAKDRELEAYRRQFGNVISGEVLPPAIEG